MVDGVGNGGGVNVDGAGSGRSVDGVGKGLDVGGVGNGTGAGGGSASPEPDCGLPHAGQNATAPSSSTAEQDTQRRSTAGKVAERATSAE